MELKETIERRASVRRFTEEQVEPDILQELVRRAGKAPSINNEQPWKFVAVTNIELIRKMGRVVHDKVNSVYPASDPKTENIKSTIDFFSTVFENAPALIVVLTSSYRAFAEKLFENKEQAHKDLNIQRYYPDVQSIGAAVQNILLSAVDLGYGAVWLSALLVARKELEEMLEIKSPWSIATAVAVGKPDGIVTPTRRKDINDIFELKV
ncbi:nitroreductase family protein [candidate division KSB1 bacterium]|nr:nitroreductase family protein [candidate division KSB1 bacterium]